MSSRYDSDQVAASKATHPDLPFPDQEDSGTGSGLSKEEEDEMINSINSRASRGSDTRMERHTSSSSRYGDTDVAAAEMKHPDHSYPDSPKVGGGMTKQEQDQMISDINRRASSRSYQVITEQSESSDTSTRLRRNSSSSQRYEDTDVAAAHANHPDHSYPDSPHAGTGMSKQEQDAMIQDINKRASKKMVHDAHIVLLDPAQASAKYRHKDVEAAHHAHPSQPFPDDMTFISNTDDTMS